MTNTSLIVTGTRENTTPAVQYLVPKESFLATAHPILHHAQRALALQNDSAARAMGSASETVQLFASGLNSESWQELLQLQQAVWQRLFTLQKGWVRDWKDWVLYFDQIKGANTISKLAEREGNIVAQFVQLLGAQGTDLIGLLENIQVDYSYWVHEKLREKRRLR